MRPDALGVAHDRGLARQKPHRRLSRPREVSRASDGIAVGSKGRAKLLLSLCVDRSAGASTSHHCLSNSTLCSSFRSDSLSRIASRKSFSPKTYKSVGFVVRTVAFRG